MRFGSPKWKFWLRRAWRRQMVIPAPLNPLLKSWLLWRLRFRGYAPETFPLDPKRQDRIHANAAFRLFRWCEVPSLPADVLSSMCRALRPDQLNEDLTLLLPKKKRLLAISILGQIGTPEAISELVSVLKDQDQEVRRASLDALVQNNTPAVVHELFDSINRYFCLSGDPRDLLAGGGLYPETMYSHFEALFRIAEQNTDK